MVGDIIYIPTWQGWLYLAIVTDCLVFRTFADVSLGMSCRESLKMSSGLPSVISDVICAGTCHLWRGGGGLG